MATEILKEFLVAVGFRVDEENYKRQQKSIKDIGDQLGTFERDERERDVQHRRRADRQKSTYADLATAWNLWARTIKSAAETAGAAVGQLIGGFDNLYFVSQRTGASVNNLKSIGYAFSQVGSSAESAMQAIDSFAKARRTNPGINGLLRSYGVDTRGDTADVMMRGVDAIQARHPYYTGAQVAGLLGISEDQFQTLTKYREQIKAYREEYARTQRALNVNSDDTARASATIQRSIGSLTATLGVLSEKLYTILAPVLERIVKGFRNWIESHPEQVEKIMQGIARGTEMVGNALTQVGDWLADEKNQKRLEEYWDKFTSRIKETAQQIKELLEMLLKIGRYLGFGSSTAEDPLGVGHVVSGLLGTGGGNGQGTTAQTEKPGILRRGWNAVKRAFGGGSTGATDTSPITPGPHPILDLITKAEGTKRGYNDSFNHQISGSLTDKTLDQIDAIQGGMSGSSAIGKYQFMRKTLGGLRSELGLSGKEMFTPELQDRLAMQLYRRRMAQAKREGGGDAAVLKALAQEWASFPTASGQGYYPGQHAAVSPSNVLNAVRAEEAGKTAPKAAPAPRLNFTPGGFNVEDYLQSRPMGSSSSNTDNSRSVSQNNPVTVNVHGASDPQATGSAVMRAVGSANDMSLRNVQTAIR